MDRRLSRSLDDPDSLPRITVVTPSFNQAQFLESTMESIHDQGYPNLEHIVIDGGSTDGSFEIIKGYADRLAFWVSEKDNGQTDALIKGFEQASGDIHCWLNSDDLFEPKSLFTVARYFEAHPEVRFIYGDSVWIDRWGEIIKPKKEHRWSEFVWMYHHNYIPQPSTFWRADLYEQVGGLNRRFDLAMDADLFIRFAQVTKPTHVRKTFSRMRFYPDQKNTSLRHLTGTEGRLIRSRYVLPMSRRQQSIRKRLARIWRFWLKLSSGCYSLSEIALHSRKFFDGQTWEMREKKRAREFDQG